MYKRKGKYFTTMAPTLWAALPMLESARRLNERCFALLARCSHDGAAREASAVFLRADLWARLDEHAAERAARCPVLLLNLNFHQLEWWQRAAEGQAKPLVESRATPLFGMLEMAPLLRAILLEVWSISRVNSRAACVLFGMSPAVAQVIAGLSAPGVNRIVDEYATLVRPRWEENRIFWLRFLEALSAENEDALTHVHLHALQLLGSETVFRHV